MCRCCTSWCHRSSTMPPRFPQISSGTLVFSISLRCPLHPQSHRPLFLCEKMLDQIDAESRRKRTRLDLSMGGQSTSRRKQQPAIVALEDQSEHKSKVLNDVLATSSVPNLVSKDINELWPGMKKSPSVTFDHTIQTIPEANVPSARKDIERQARQEKKLKAPPVTTTKQGRPALEKRRSSTALLGAYTNLQKNRETRLDCSGHIPTQNLIESAIAERKWNDGIREIFERLGKSRLVARQPDLVCICSSLASFLNVLIIILTRNPISTFLKMSTMMVHFPEMSLSQGFTSSNPIYLKSN